MRRSDFLGKLPALAALMAGLAMASQGQAAEALDGKALFQSRCGMCHQTIGMAWPAASSHPAITTLLNASV